MFETNTFKMQQYTLSGSYQAAGAAPEVSQAIQLYRKASLKATLSKLLSKVSGRGRRLLILSEVEKSLKVNNRRYAGVKAVLISQVRGSEGRSDDFDTDFNPLNERSKDRWLSIAIARQNGVPLPPVELIQVGDFYFVRDGHHRISVAQAFGEEAIDAEVTIWHTANPLPWEKVYTPNALQVQAV